MKDWIPAVVAVIGLLGAGGGVWSMLTVGATRRRLVAEAENLTANTITVLSRSAVEMLEPLQARVTQSEQEAAAARQAAAQARHEAEQATQEVNDLRTAVAELTRVLKAWRAAILAPGVTVDALRAMVTADSVNGNGRPE